MGYYVNHEYMDQKLQATDITWLFRMAQEWLTTNPGEQIPLDIWAAKVAEIPESRELPLAIIVGGIGIHHISPDIIPALAAISLRISPEGVAKALDHHGADFFQMINVRYEYDDLTAEQMKSTVPADTKNHILDSFSIAYGVIQALASNPRQRTELIRQALEYSCTPSTTLAKLHSDVPELWTTTHIQEASERLAFATNSDLPRSVQTDYSSFWDALRYVQLPDDFSNDDYIRLLDRSGALRLDANKQSGYIDDLFRRILADGVSHNAQRFLDAINSEERPEIVERISKKMLSALKSYGLDGLGWTKKLNDALDERYGQAYSKVLGSLSVRLCLTDLDPMAVELMRASHRDPNGLFPYTQSKVSELLKDASTEFMAIPLTSLEHDDFRVIHRVLRVGASGIPQEYGEIPVPDLIARILIGAETYAERYKQQPEGSTATDTHRLADAIVDYLVKRAEPDYTLYNTLSSRSQRVLAGAGLDIKKFPNMSRADRGRVLESHLGM